MRRAPLLLVMVAALSACGDIPQPFRHEGIPGALARPKMTRGVTVRPPADSPDGRVLAEAMVRALEDQEVPALVHDGAAFGHVIDGQVQDGGKSLAVRWILRAPDGAEAAASVQTLPKALLAQADPVLMKRAATNAAAVLAGPLADPDARAVFAPQPAADSRSVVSVLPLRGLPGDGDTALAEAMRRALTRGGVLVKDEGADYLVEGKVTVAPGLPGEDTVTVAWVVKRAKGGAELGNIGQGGAVPRGRLSQPWGLLARDIAEGGASGVVEVVLADTGDAGRRKGP
ncbi:MAG: hypothetical protein NVV74_08325 [Magnetospirillum sp.]|nr:hypothetical protein [Magnetospirillum sp.]